MQLDEFFGFDSLPGFPGDLIAVGSKLCIIVRRKFRKFHANYINAFTVIHDGMLCDVEFKLFDEQVNAAYADICSHCDDAALVYDVLHTGRYAIIKQLSDALE